MIENQANTLWMRTQIRDVLLEQGFADCWNQDWAQARGIPVRFIEFRENGGFGWAIFGVNVQGVYAKFFETLLRHPDTIPTIADKLGLPTSLVLGNDDRIEFAVQVTNVYGNVTTLAISTGFQGC